MKKPQEEKRDARDYNNIFVSTLQFGSFALLP